MIDTELETLIDTELERDINRYGELVEIIVSDIKITDTYGTRYRRLDYEVAEYRGYRLLRGYEGWSATEVRSEEESY